MCPRWNLRPICTRTNGAMDTDSLTMSPNGEVDTKKVTQCFCQTPTSATIHLPHNEFFPPHSLIHNYISYYKQVTTTNQNVLWIPQQVPFWYTCMCRTLFVANLCRVWIWYRTRRVWVFSLGRHRIIERTLLFYRLLYSRPQKAFHNFDRIVSYWKLRPFFFFFLLLLIYIQFIPFLCILKIPI